jgi:DNA-binding XRE family transcriptional regulator
MSKPQIIRTEAGEELVVLSRRDYDAMRARLGDEDAEDRMTVRLIKEARASGRVAAPLSVWDEVEAASSPIGPLRKWRKLTQEELAAKAGISQGYLSELETGRKAGDLATLRRVAAALGVGLDDVIHNED